MRTATTLIASLAAGVWLTPSPGQVERTADMTEARASHTMTTLRDGRVLITGGFAGNDTEDSPFRSTEIFDPRTARFSAAAPLLHGRTGHTATLLPDGRVLVAGGWTASRETFGPVELYDPAGSRASVPIAPAVKRAGHTATVLEDGRVLLAGGVDNDGTELNSAELFDPRTGKLSPTGTMIATRAAHAAALLPDGRVVILGGSDGRYPNARVHRSIEIYDPVRGTFAAAGQLLEARHKHAAALVDGKVLVVGGSDNRDWRGRFDSAEIYDPATGKSSLAGGMGAKRFKLTDAVVSLGTDRVLVAGGGETVEMFAADTRRFHRIHGTLDAARYYSVAALLPDGRVLITGGYSEGGRLPATKAAYLFTASR